MKHPLRFGIVVWLVCCAFLFAQSNPASPEQKREAPASSGSPPAERHSPPPILTQICGEKTPPPCATAPHVVFAPDPEYSEDARNARYQGTCVLRMIVGTDGKAHDIRVARTVGHGLDEKAIEAVKQWIFEPAMLFEPPTREGKPVPVQINAEITFRLNPVVVSPWSAQLVAGAKQQFAATVPGATNSAVNWSVGGPGCAAPACGSISADGLYTAPLGVLNPVSVIVTAASVTDPAKTGSAKVTIQPSPSP
jgi:TonB family protein